MTSKFQVGDLVKTRDGGPKISEEKYHDLRDRGYLVSPDDIDPNCRQLELKISRLEGRAEQRGALHKTPADLQSEGATINYRDDGRAYVRWWRMMIDMVSVIKAHNLRKGTK